jgi:transposase
LKEILNHILSIFNTCDRTSGSASHQRQSRRRPSKFEESALRAYVLAHPEAYLSEIASVFKGSESGVCRAFKRFKISRKKRHFSTQNVRNPNESHLLRS